MKWNTKLERLRGERTVEEVSEATLISPNMYEAYERGDREPLDSVKEILADYFGKTVSEIFG